MKTLALLALLFSSPAWSAGRSGFSYGTASSSGGGAPTGAAGGDLSGTYPNPTLNATQANVKTLSGLTTISSAFTETSSMTNTSGGGINVTYGVTAGSATFGATGVNTAAANLDVNGNSQFGVGVNRSTFTVTGDLVLNAGSTITLSGANGFITGKSSITASAFFGDGSHLSGVASTFTGGTVANQTTFQSSVTVQGAAGLSVTYAVTAGSGTFGAVGVNTAAANLDVNGNAQFGSGVNRSTFSTTGDLTMNSGGVISQSGANGRYVGSSSVTASAFFGDASHLTGLSSGTVSVALSGTFTNTTLGLCVASSTGSMVLPQVSDIRFDVHCTISVASLAAVIGAGVIVDGGFIDGETAAKGAIAPLEPVSTDGTNMAFTVYASGLSAASHSYCFSPFVSANTGTIDSTNSICHLHAHISVP